jgi:phospho-N-acetylmuramoyl-pentapeptide-transferase
MFYWLADLSSTLPIFNVFRYLTVRTAGSTITALVFVFMFGPWIIDHLRLRQGKGQPIRADGPKSHILTKAGTPTMGGLMILLGIVVATLLWANPRNPYVWIVLAVTLGFGLVGFYDDYLKVTRQSHDGFSGKSRLAVETVIALAA